MISLIFLATAVAFAAVDGPALYKQRCARCHDASGETRAPAPSALKQMSPENIVRPLESGLMKDQGASLSAAERRTVAEFLTGKTIGVAATATTGVDDPGPAVAGGMLYVSSGRGVWAGLPGNVLLAFSVEGQ